MQRTLPLWIGLLIYVVFLAGGHWLLTDPDTFWQISVGRWIAEHRTPLTMRGQPWTSTY
ncbi:hypothetical protein V1291_001631 [Nitrobacteraceae bacterium AZCC 1564]